MIDLHKPTLQYGSGISMSDSAMMRKLTRGGPGIITY